ncbi:hypothetical protein C8Q76DRAFT_799408 [Earliella scabrosa]|nr:hypothetical protein C8Q76DRAFT_799408 [Earliella scabrosa]
MDVSFGQYSQAVSLSAPHQSPALHEEQSDSYTSDAIITFGDDARNIVVEAASVCNNTDSLDLQVSGHELQQVDAVPYGFPTYIDEEELATLLDTTTEDLRAQLRDIDRVFNGIVLSAPLNPLWSSTNPTLPDNSAVPEPQDNFLCTNNLLYSEEFAVLPSNDLQLTHQITPFTPNQVVRRQEVTVPSEDEWSPISDSIEVSSSPGSTSTHDQHSHYVSSNSDVLPLSSRNNSNRPRYHLPITRFLQTNSASVAYDPVRLQMQVLEQALFPSAP